MKRYSALLCFLAIAGVIVLCYWLHWHVWRLLHPTAPVWTFFFSS